MGKCGWKLDIGQAFKCPLVRSVDYLMVSGEVEGLADQVKEGSCSLLALTMVDNTHDDDRYKVEESMDGSNSEAPHTGTTILALVYNGGVILAADSRFVLFFNSLSLS